MTNRPISDQDADLRQAMLHRVEDSKYELATLLAETHAEREAKFREIVDDDQWPLPPYAAGKDLVPVKAAPSGSYDDRAWDPELVAPRERRLFRALGTGDGEKVLNALERLEARSQAMRAEYGNVRAFAYEYVVTDMKPVEELLRMFPLVPPSALEPVKTVETVEPVSEDAVETSQYPHLEELLKP
jgi:hypothetical protein